MSRTSSIPGRESVAREVLALADALASLSNRANMLGRLCPHPTIQAMNQTASEYAGELARVAGEIRLGQVLVGTDPTPDKGGYPLFEQKPVAPTIPPPAVPPTPPLLQWGEAAILKVTVGDRSRSKPVRAEFVFHFSDRNPRTHPPGAAVLVELPAFLGFKPDEQTIPVSPQEIAGQSPEAWAEAIAQQLLKDRLAALEAEESQAAESVLDTPREPAPPSPSTRPRSRSRSRAKSMSASATEEQPIA